MSLFKKPQASYNGSEVLTTIGPDATLIGSMTLRGCVRVDGKLDGHINNAVEVVIGPNGCVRGNITAERVEVGGSVIGDVTASDRLELRAGGRIEGNIRSPRLLIENGAFFEGSCAMTVEGAAPAVTDAPASP